MAKGVKQGFANGFVAGCVFALYIELTSEHALTENNNWHLLRMIAIISAFASFSAVTNYGFNRFFSAEKELDSQSDLASIKIKEV